MINLNVPYLNDESIALAADSFLKQNDLTSIPIDIEHIIESNYHMDIVLLPDLQMAFDIEGFSTSSNKAILPDLFISTCLH